MLQESMTKEVDEAFRAGANDYIVKPVNPKMLVGKIKKALAS